MFLRGGVGPGAGKRAREGGRGGQDVQPGPLPCRELNRSVSSLSRRGSRPVAGPWPSAPEWRGGWRAPWCPGRLAHLGLVSTFQPC